MTLKTIKLKTIKYNKRRNKSQREREREYSPEFFEKSRRARQLLSRDPDQEAKTEKKHKKC